MPGSIVRLVTPEGLARFHCPVTGRAVFDLDNGFDPELQTTRHLLFFIDWVNEIFIQEVEGLPEPQANTQHLVRQVLVRGLEEGEGWSQLMPKCAEVLPDSAVIFHLVEPRWGPKPEMGCYACFDVAPIDVEDETPKFEVL